MATTITVSDETLARFKSLKAATGDESVPELSSDQFMKSLLDAWEENGESVYGDQHADVNASELARELSTIMNDDVKSACRAAIRDELPVEQMGGR